MAETCDGPADCIGSAPMCCAHGLREASRVAAVVSYLDQGVVFVDAAGQVAAVVPPMPEGAEQTAAWLGADGTPLPADQTPVARVLATGQPLHAAELALRRPDGSVVWRLVNAEPVPAGLGLPAGVMLAFSDLTERRRADEAFREREAQLRAVAEGTTDAVFIKDLDGRYLLANSSTQRFIGLPTEQIIGRTDIDFMPLPDAQCIMAQDRETMASGQVQTHEEWITFHGRRHVFLSTKGPVRDDRGQVIGLFGVSRDITGRVQGELQLRQGEARLRTMVRLSQALARPIELSTVLQMVIDGATELLRLESGAVYLGDDGQVELAATHPPLPPDFPPPMRRMSLEDHPQMALAMARLQPVVLPDLAEATLSAAEQAICALRGLRSLVFVPLISGDRAIGVLILGSAHAPRGYTGDELELLGGFAGQAAQTIEHVRLFEAERRHAELLAREVAERRRAEQALAVEAQQAHDSEERFRALFEQAGDFAFVLERRPGLEPIILDANEAACRAHGYEREELVGQSIALVSAGPVPSAPDGRPLPMVVGETRRFETEHRRKDGSAFPVEVVVTMVARAHGEPVMFSTERDITDRVNQRAERERLLAELAQAQKMESVGRLAGGIAHDFNNMLGAIQGYAEMALYDAGSPEALQEDIKQVLQACRRSADLTRQLLAFARRQTIAPQVQDLNNTVSSMLAMLRRVIGEQIDLVWQPGGALWLACVDSSQIDQILANLCVNASDAIGGVGTITIETRNVWLDESGGMEEYDCAPGEYIELSVCDTGCGMDEATLARVFEPFYTTKEVGHGTGLGLSMVYGSVRQNGGFIHVASQPGQGSTFSLYFPRHHGQVELAEEGQQISDTAGRGETILLVEDDPSILVMVARLLRHRGYQVLATGSPQEALRLAAESDRPIELLLTDVVMPVMNGRDLAEALTAEHPGLRCLFMTGYPDDVLARHGVRSTQIQVIGKPFSTNDLLQRLRSLLTAGPA